MRRRFRPSLPDRPGCMKLHSSPFFLGLALLAGATGVAAPAAEPITHIADIRSLPRQDAAKALPVRVRGIVTWRHARIGHFTVQDDSAGIWVNVREAKTLQIWTGDDAELRHVREGAEVEIVGVSNAGGFSPVIVPQSVVVLGEKPLPAARPMERRRLFTGAEANQRIEVRGVVQGFHATPDGWQLYLDTVPGQISAEVAREVVPQPAAIVDAEVRLRGVVASSFNTRGELTGLRMLTNVVGDLVVEKPAPPPAAVPLVPLDSLLPFSPEPPSAHRVRIHGTVTFVVPGEFCYVQEATRALRVEANPALTLQAGDRVEVWGFVETTRHIGMLVGAEGRKMGPADVPAAVAISPEEVIALNATAANFGHVAQPHDFDGHLIRFRARLLAVQAAPDGKKAWRRLTLEQGSMILMAILPMGAVESLDGLLPGSDVEVTGIVQLEYAKQSGPGQTFRAVGLEVMLRSAGDVLVVRAPSWWTPRRLLGLMAIVVLILGVALLWAWQLRRQVQRKSHQLAEEMRARRDAAIEFQATLRERNRLAANLHDTLLQTLSGLNYQLEACEVESLPVAARPANHLETARRMVQRGQEDLRGTVWALRVLPLKGRTITDALRALAQQVGEGHSVKVSVQGEAKHPHLSEFVAGNLLLVAQEAMHNALKHATPSSIEVQVSAAEGGKRIRLVVRDDGAGFDPVAVAGPSAGHFGLSGMRERVERLGGALRIESAPGHGTTVHVDVPLRPFDEEIS